MHKESILSAFTVTARRMLSVHGGMKAGKKG